MPQPIPFALTRSNHAPPPRRTRTVFERRISVAAEGRRAVPKKQNLTNYDRLQILDFYHENCYSMSQLDMIPHLREMGYVTITQPTLSRLLRNEPFIRDYVNGNPRALYEKRHPLVTLPEVDAAVKQWVIQKLQSNLRLTGDIICEKARDFCRRMGSPDNLLSFSHGWLRSFNARLGLSQHIFHGEAASAPVATLEDERFRLVAIICLYAPWDVYNCDETALLYCLVPTRGLALEQMPGVKLDKTRITYLFCVNMDGSDKRQPLIIGRARQPNCFEKRFAYELGYYYFWNKKAWMVQSIWQVFLYHLNEDMRRQGRHILLLVDNAPSHKHNPEDYPYVRIEFLAPNMTAWIQPLDGGIIRSFKAHYKRRFIQSALERDDQGLANIYKVNQLQAMQLAAAAWNDVKPETIARCWNHVGLVPSYQPTPPAPTSYSPTFPSTFDHHVPPQPYFGDSFADQVPIHPEFQEALSELDMNLLTEHEWTDEEIVDQVLGERTEGFMDPGNGQMARGVLHSIQHAYIPQTHVYY